MSENGLTAKERVVNRHKDDKQISIGQENTLTIPRFSQQLDLTDTLKVSESSFTNKDKQKKCDYYFILIFFLLVSLEGIATFGSKEKFV